MKLWLFLLELVVVAIAVNGIMAILAQIVRKKIKEIIIKIYNVYVI